MMQDYEFNEADATTDTVAQPSDEVLRNIVGFARCYQMMETEGMQVRFFLN